MNMKHKIFDSNFPYEKVPSGFDAIKITLDGSLKSDLSWNEPKEEARELIKCGHKIFWEMDLGIFSGLKKPLSYNSQFLSFKLSLEHFTDKLWSEFKDNTVGIALFRGNADFSDGYLWDEDQEDNLQGWIEEKFIDLFSLNHELESQFETWSEIGHDLMWRSLPGNQLLQLYCRDILAEYFAMLANQLPYGIQASLLLDTQGFSDPVHLATVLSKEHFPHLTLGIKGDLLPMKEFSWEDVTSSAPFFIGRQLPMEEPLVSPITGVCLPSLSFFKPSEYKKLRVGIDRLALNNVKYRIIPEELLTSEWEGLDYLIVSPENLTFQGKRMLMGFCAAGGTVVNLGDKMTLSKEIPMEEFLLSFPIH